MSYVKLSNWNTACSGSNGTKLMENDSEWFGMLSLPWHVAPCRHTDAAHCAPSGNATRGSSAA